jgi:hypothetical protein
MEIKVYIHPNGEVKVAVAGVKGDQCLKLTEFLEQALGHVTEREMTPEFYETVREQLKVVQRLNDQAGG